VPDADAISLPRQQFFIGVGVVALVVAALAYYSFFAEADPVDSPAAPAPALGIEGSIAVGDVGADGEVIADERDAAIANLQAQLATAGTPALPGTAIRRIVVAADASFVSVGVEGVAVVGPFGGYAAIDPSTNAVTANSQVSAGATRVMRTASAVWITDYADSLIVRVDPVANSVVSTFDFPNPDGIAKFGPTLLVSASNEGHVSQVDPNTGAILQTALVLGKPTDIVVTEDEQIWVGLFDTGEVVQIDPATFTVTNRVTVGAGPSGLAIADGMLWVADSLEGTVMGVDLATLEVVHTLPVGDEPTEVEVFQGSVWVSVKASGELVQIDPVEGVIVTRTPLGTSARGGPTGMDVGAGSLWVAVRGERSVVRVTPGGG